MCDLMETLASPAGTYACFPICDNFKQYVDTSTSALKCNDCHQSCRYCRDNPNRDNCYICNSHDLFLADTSYSPPINPYTSTSNTLQCECAEGTVTNDQRFCHSCDKRCSVCIHQLNVDCDMCADGAYKVYNSECATRCPQNYI